MRFTLLVAGLSLSGCALVDALSGGKDGSPDPETNDADIGQCEQPQFEGPFDEPTSAAGPTTVAMGDFDGDTYLDFAVGESTGIEFFFGNGGGGFPRNQFVPNGVSKSFDLVAGEFDGALDDLLAASDDTGNPSPILLGKENPAEISATPSGLGRAVALEVADLDRQNGEDAVSVVNYSGYFAMVMLNDGTGNLTMGPGSWSFDTLPSQVLAGDFVGDSSEDLAFLDLDGATFLQGDGVGGFSSSPHAQSFPAQGKRMVRFPDETHKAVLFSAALECNPCEESPIFATYERDGSTVGLHLYTGFGVISPVEAVVATIDGDVQADLVIANGMGTGDSPPEVLVGTCWNGDKFGRVTPLDVGGTPADVAVGDLNGDGLDDIVVAIPTTNQVNVMLSSTDGGN